MAQMNSAGSLSAIVPALLVAQCVDWIEACCPPGWIEGREKRQCQRHHHNRAGFTWIHFGGESGEKIQLWREQLGVCEPRQKLPNGFNVEANDGPDQKPRQRSHHAD